MISEEVKLILSRYTETELYDENIDIRKSGIDSIQYIQFLAEIEDEMSVDFGYDKLDTIDPVSIYNISQLISELKEK